MRYFLLAISVAVSFGLFFISWSQPDSSSMRLVVRGRTAELISHEISDERFAEEIYREVSPKVGRVELLLGVLPAHPVHADRRHGIAHKISVFLQ